MKYTWSQRLLGVLGTCFLLPLATVRGQAPQAPASHAANNTVRQLEADLEARRGKLHELVAQQNRLSLEIQVLEAEDRLALQRLQEAKARQAGGVVRPPRSPAATEERLERLEQQVQTLQRQLREVRSGPSGENKTEIKKFRPVDLQPKANHKLTDNFGRLEGNNLASLPRGEHTFAGVPFKIGDRLLLLGSELLQTKPDRVEGIPVGKAFTRLDILHATVFGRSEPEIADNTRIAEYKVNYEDGDTETIPVVYGKDVRDWWYSADDQGVSKSKVIWTGENEVTKDKSGFQRPPAGIRLYLSTWDNPHPTKKVARIDYMKVGDTPAAPFCVALTVEDN